MTDIFDVIRLKREHKEDLEEMFPSGERSNEVEVRILNGRTAKDTHKTKTKAEGETEREKLRDKQRRRART